MISGIRPGDPGCAVTRSGLVSSGMPRPVRPNAAGEETVVGTSPQTIAGWAAFYEAHGRPPFPFAAGGEESTTTTPPPPSPKPVTFESQEKLDQIIEREKAKAAEAAQRDPAFLQELREQVKADLAADLARTKKQEQGEFAQMLEDVLGLKPGAIPDTSALGQAMTGLHGRNKELLAACTSIVAAGKAGVSDEMAALMPEDLTPDKQVAWLEKALKVAAKEKKEPPKKTNGHEDPKPKGD